MTPDTDLRWQVPAQDRLTYTIEVAEPLCDPGNRALLDSGSAEHRLIVWDSGVPAHWRASFADYFRHHGVSVSFLPIEGGEPCKDLAVAVSLIRALHEHGLDRSHEPLIVVGGGAVLDLAGFAASICGGGLPVIRVPTTLLAWVDASVGIKTGVNFSGTKNLVGTFTPPGRVLLDCAFFASLPELEWTSGIGEILKLGLGCDETIFELLEQETGSFWPGRLGNGKGRVLLYRSIEVMLAELGDNIYESELARTVDMGHTFSQSFEMSEPPMRHGHAVAVDLLMSAFISAQRGMLPRADLDRLVSIAAAYRLPAAPPRPDAAAAWASVIERTQHRNTKQRVPLPTRIGHAGFAHDLTHAEVEAAMRWVVAIGDGRRPGRPEEGTL